MPPSNAQQTGRLTALDGMRGIAIVLVVLSHGWVLWPVDFFDTHWVIRPLMRSGNSAVTVFFVVAGFLMYRSLSAAQGLRRMRPGVKLVRRVLRVGPSLWAMLLVLMVVAALDPTDKTAWSDNRDSVVHVFTYTWNWYVEGNLLTSRPDFGHLWYLSVEMQAFVIMTLILYMMRRRPVGLLFLVSGFYLLLTWWRFHVTHTEFLFKVLVRTTARMDAFVLGVLLGAALVYIARLPVKQRTWSWTLTASCLALLPLLLWCAADPKGDADHQFLTWGGTMLQIDLAFLVCALALLQSGSIVTRVLEHRSLVVLGEWSLLIYIWHFPIFEFVERHTGGWAWPWKVLVAAVLLVVVCLVTHRLIERRVSSTLKNPGWRRLDNGLSAFASDVVRRYAHHGSRQTTS